MKPMFFVLVLIIVANYVAIHIIKDTDIAIRWVVGVFLVYQGWSVLENWSSENDNKMVKALELIMVNKVERHLNVSISNVL